jgi:AI-2E family transporter
VGIGWAMLLWTATLFAVLEIVAGQIIEPHLFGRSSGLSPIAVIVSASFWTWLWGPVGLVLATPLTICLVVVGRHVDHLRFLDIMLGDKPPLTPSQLVYQRMLAGDPIEAIEQAQTYLEDASIEDYYDQILLNGLRLAEDDAHAGRLDDRLKRILTTVEEVVDELDDHEDEAVHALPTVVGISMLSKEKDEISLPERWKSDRSVLCIPGSAELDEASALVLAQILRRKGFGAKAEKAGALTISQFFSLDLSNTGFVCLCFMNNPSQARIQYSIKRFIRKNNQARIVVALLGTDNGENSNASIKLAHNISIVAGTFATAANSILQGANDASNNPHSPTMPTTAVGISIGSRFERG